jgi:hypothetical protein
MPDDGDASPRCPAYEAPMQLGIRVPRILGCGRRTLDRSDSRNSAAIDTYSAPVIEAARGETKKATTRRRPSSCSAAKGSLVYEYLADAAVFHALMGAGPERGSSLVLDDGLLGEAARHGCAVALKALRALVDREAADPTPSLRPRSTHRF